MKDQYISALKQIIATDKHPKLDVLLADLKKVLASRGHSRLLPAILRGLVRQLPKDAETIIVTLTRSPESELKQYADEIAATVKEITGDEVAIDSKHIAVREDSSLVGGYTLQVDGKLIDRSYKTTLLTLYRTITN